MNKYAKLRGTKNVNSIVSLVLPKENHKIKASQNNFRFQFAQLNQSNWRAITVFQGEVANSSLPGKMAIKNVCMCLCVSQCFIILLGKYWMHWVCVCERKCIKNTKHYFVNLSRFHWRFLGTITNSDKMDIKCCLLEHSVQCQKKPPKYKNCPITWLSVPLSAGSQRSLTDTNLQSLNTSKHTHFTVGNL